MAPEDAAARLFPHHPLDAVLGPPPSPFALARLLEDGSAQDLRALFAVLDESSARAWFLAHGARALSRRSRAFWRLVLGAETPRPTAEPHPFWPLA